MFNSVTVRQNLSKNAETMLSFTHEQIDSKLIASRVLLGSFAQTVQLMIMEGHIDSLKRYMILSSEYAMSDESGLSAINGLYGYFETIFGQPVYIDGSNWFPPDSFYPPDRKWYQAAIKNCGEISETEPYIDAASGGYIISYSRCIKDNSGNHVGVVSIDVSLEEIGEIVTNAALNEGGYGVLADRNLIVISYDNLDFIGRPLSDPEIALSKFTDMFQRGETIYEQPIINWKGESVIGFSRILPNGWHLILLTPKDKYYLGNTRMLIVLCLLGAVLSFGLIVFLIQTDRAKAKASEESKQKSAFLANMSHEIRTPMNAIIGMTYIGKNADDIPRKNYCLDRIENASQHLLGVINDVLDMSKIEANMFELCNEEFDFEKMLQRIINIICFRAEEKKQKITVHIDKSIPRFLIGDEQRLAQVITNLLGNAVKFTPEGGLIKLDTRFIKEEDSICRIRVTVKDSGIGISEEQQKRLFRAFQQADSRIARKFGGTGLGLAISKNIVEMMGGKMKLESEIGKGSSFSFKFKARRGNKKMPSLSEYGINWNDICIVAVDDDNEFLNYFTGVVNGLGAACNTALNGAEALSHFDNNKTRHIYFIDWKMPGMDGIALAKEIKARNKNPDNSIIVLISAAEWSDIADEAKEAGVEKFLSKPLFPSAIEEIIADAVGIKNMEEEKEDDRSGIFEGYKILLAEDVEINQEIIDTLIEPTLLKMDCASNGLEAVNMFDKSPDDYDLILMDVQMPEMDGYEATRRIRRFSHPKAKTVPIIAMTANVFKEDIDKCLIAGMDGHVGKPIDVDEFFNILKKYLSK